MVKKKKAAKSPSAPKGRGAPKSVENYLARAPEPARTRLIQMRQAIRSAVPADAIEIISYGIPAFKRKKVLVWYAGFANHCSLFPTSAVIEAFKDELKGLSTSKGTVHFPLDRPLPLALIKKIVKARVAATATEPSR